MEIPLTQGQVAIVDNEDADLASVKWCAKQNRRKFYAMRKEDGRFLHLHQVIAARMGIVGMADHIDRNGLNNRRSNLRPADDSQNMANRDRQINNTSGFKGVSWYKPRGTWRARIKIGGKSRCLGYFHSPVDAALAYDRAAIELFGEFAKLNFKS